MTQVELIDFLESQGYYNLRALPDGRVIGLYRFIFTIGLVVGLDPIGYQCRYCYDPIYSGDAKHDVVNWDGEGDPEGEWIVKK